MSMPKMLPAVAAVALSWGSISAQASLGAGPTAAIRSAAIPSAAKAAPASAAFQTPSGNVHCFYLAERGGSLRCDVLSNEAPVPPVPASCEFDYGSAFEMTTRGRAQRACVSDTVADPSNRVVAYGTTWRQGGFSCTSATSGLTCRNAAGKGFVLSKRAQRLF